MLPEIYESLLKNSWFLKQPFLKELQVLESIPIRHKRNPKGFPSATFEHSIGLRLPFWDSSIWIWVDINIFPQIASDENLIQLKRTKSTETTMSNIPSCQRLLLFSLTSFVWTLRQLALWACSNFSSVHLSLNTDIQFGSSLQICLIPFWGLRFPDVLHWNTRPPARTVGWIFYRTPSPHGTLLNKTHRQRENLHLDYFIEAQW